MIKSNTIGIDMGDRSHTYCKLNRKGEVISKNTVKNTVEAIRKCFGKLEPSLFALEAGTHSAWVSHAPKDCAF